MWPPGRARPLLSLLTVGLFAVAVPARAALDDTGQDQCYDGSALSTCTAADTGDGAPYPNQDGRFGRDAEAAARRLAKRGGGEAGFDFTPLDGAGNPIALAGGVPASPAACVYDNVTGLTWEVKSADGGLRDHGWTYTWFSATHNGGNAGVADGGVGSGSDHCADPARCDTASYTADVNAAALCGYADWRLPSSAELASIVHAGRFSPAVDPDFFPNTAAAGYWSADSYAPAAAEAWLVGFYDGTVAPQAKSGAFAVRLVRSGP